MLLPRCTHRRLWCTPLREFHTTRPYLRGAQDIFQMDPHTAEPVIDSSPWVSESRPMSNSRTSMKLRAGKQNAKNKEFLSTKLSLHIRPRDRSARTSEGDGRNAAQSVSNEYGGNTSHTSSPLLGPPLADGRIQPRVSGDPFLKDVLPPSPQSPIATLAHGLDRVLFNPGVQWLQRPRSPVYNFSTWLQQIIPVKNFAFERLQSFVPSSRDEDLYTMAQRESRKYAGSTSSLTGLLGQLYYLISGDKPVNTANLSDCFQSAPQTFTPGQRGAASVKLNYRNGVYLIDSAEDAIPGVSNKIILTWMGTLLEKFLTHPPREFLNLTRSVDDPAVVTKEPRREAYRYAKSDKFVLRSQLDCFHSRLPGTGVFDIKTRAVMSIRHDVLNFEEGSGYQILALKGIDKSFEREYYDLIRSAFLKYSFQARIGNMAGVFVAYHNTERIFGFQYIPLLEMDARLFGKSAVGDAVFEKCMLLLEEVLEMATHELPCQSIRLTAEKQESESELRVFLEPAEWDEEHRGSRPVIQLDVSAKNYINESVTDGWSAVEKSNLPWTVSWSISKSTLNTNTIRRNLAGARKRSIHKLPLPKGVRFREMENFWHGLQFNPTAPVDVPFRADLIRYPTTNVKYLRTLAKEGRKYLNRSTRKQIGKPKRVRGIPDDAITVAPLVALAHGPIADASKGPTTTLSRKIRKQMRLEDQRRKREVRKARRRTDLAQACAP